MSELTNSLTDEDESQSFRRAFNNLRQESIMMSSINSSKESFYENCMKVLLPQVEYPDDLIYQLYQFTINFVRKAAKNKSTLSNLDKIETAKYFQKIGCSAYKKICSFEKDEKQFTIEFANLEDCTAKNEKTWGVYHSCDNSIKLSFDLMEQPVEDRLAVAVHEIGHYIINQYAASFSPVPKESLSSGLQWHQHKRLTGKKYYSFCPEEALVRQMASVVVELFSPNTPMARTAAFAQLHGVKNCCYQYNRSAKQFLSKVIEDPKLKTESSEIIALRDQRQEFHRTVQAFTKVVKSTQGHQVPKF